MKAAAWSPFECLAVRWDERVGAAALLVAEAIRTHHELQPTQTMVSYRPGRQIEQRSWTSRLNRRRIEDSAAYRARG